MVPEQGSESREALVEQDEHVGRRRRLVGRKRREEESGGMRHEVHGFGGHSAAAFGGVICFSVSLDLRWTKCHCEESKLFFFFFL